MRSLAKRAFSIFKILLVKSAGLIYTVVKESVMRRAAMDRREIRNIWMRYAEENRDLLDGRVQADIERFRKGDCRICLLDKDGKPAAGKKVKVTQKTHDFKYGANIFMLDEFPDAERNAVYREQFKSLFNLATVPFYWNTLEPEQGKPRFSVDSPKVYRRPAPDHCIKYCEENGILPKLHCLVYERFVPEWAPVDDMKAMEALYEKRFAEIAERYSGKLYEVEVINELLCEWYWNFRSVISTRRDILEWAFALAQKYFKDDVLVINEGQPLEGTAKTDYRHPYFMMIDAALAKGVRIDKIGLQHHTFTGCGAANEEMFAAELAKGSRHFDPATILKALDIYAEFNLPLEITEITVPTFGETEEDELLQADLLEVLYTCLFSHPAVDAVVYWNLPDGCAYEPKDGGWNENRCRGGLYHNDMTPKIAAVRMHELFNVRWHTDIELETDENGFVEFRGFFGEYTAECDGIVTSFGIHKGRQ